MHYHSKFLYVGAYANPLCCDRQVGKVLCRPKGATLRYLPKAIGLIITAPDYLIMTHDPHREEGFMWEVCCIVINLLRIVPLAHYWCCSGTRGEGLFVVHINQKEHDYLQLLTLRCCRMSTWLKEAATLLPNLQGEEKKA